MQVYFRLLVICTLRDKHWQCRWCTPARYHFKWASSCPSRCAQEPPQLIQNSTLLLSRPLQLCILLEIWLLTLFCWLS